MGLEVLSFGGYHIFASIEPIMEPTVASLLLQFLVEFSHGVLPLLWNPEIQKKNN